MIIKRLAASFGTLQNEELRLKEGLNIIEAPNESGKSTWCAFIRAMMYGINTTDRDKSGYLSAKTRYRPWSGLPMEGRMDVVWNGKGITLQRRQQGAYPMRDFSAVFTGTNEAVPELTEKTVGETLLGVSEPIFERSVFIRQSGLAVSQTAELEKRIAALVSTGEESISYTEVDTLLREWLRKRRYNQRGQLPALEAEARQVREKLAVIDGANEKMSGLRQEQERMEKFREDFVKENELIERRERQGARQAYESAEAELKIAQKAMDDAEAELMRSGKLPTPEDIAAIRADLERLAGCDAVCASAAARFEQAKRNLDEITSIKEKSVFSPLSAVDAQEKADRAAAAYIDAEELKTGKRAFGANTAVCLGLAVIMALLGALSPVGVWGYALAAVMAVIGAVLGVRNNRGFKQAIANAEKRSEILKEYKVSSISDIAAMAREYKELCFKEDAAAESYRAEEKETADADAALSKVKESLLEKLKRLDPATEDVSRAPAIVARTEKLLDLLEITAARRDAAKKLANRLALGVDTRVPAETEELPEAKYSKSEVQSSLRYAEKQLSSINTSLSLAQGELKALGDPVLLRTKAAELDDRLAELNRQYDAISLAIDTLSDANTDIQNRFAPLLSARTGEILETLTGGRYERLSLDKKLSAEAEKAGESVSRSMLFLSAGTVDQIYLAMRLAVCELVLPQEEPCPIVLDDALTNFDDDRMKYALDFLKSAGEKRQVILFTCHGREAQQYDGVRDVNILKLKG